jgi:putative ATPase
MMRAMGYGADYHYPHDYEGEIVTQHCRPAELAGHRYYEPGDAGAEAELKARLEQWAARRAAPAVRKRK